MASLISTDHCITFAWPRLCSATKSAHAIAMCSVSFPDLLEMRLSRSLVPMQTVYLSVPQEALASDVAGLSLQQSQDRTGEPVSCLPYDSRDLI